MTKANIINKLIKDNFNIKLITCWECWNIISINATNNDNIEDRIVCDHCNYVDEECFFPDLFY